MTAKDFNFIADIFKVLMDDYREAEPRNLEIIEDVIYEFTERLKTTNERFNEEMFLDKCGVK